MAARIREATGSQATILIRGENGVGKDFVARLLHDAGPRREHPFVRVECASLPPELLERELFGGTKPGKVSVAAGGTLVVDEIAALSMPAQLKLLQIIEQKELQTPSGSFKLQARIVALTAMDLERAVGRRSFREDLYYRLSVSSLTIPSLRERRGDVLPLAAHFLTQLTQVYHRSKPQFSPGAERALLEFAYPGNVRQLRNIIERLLVNTTGPEIREEDLPPELQPRPKGSLLSLEAMERTHIAGVLEAVHGKKSQAADILGISRKTLLEKRKRYGLD